MNELQLPTSTRVNYEMLSEKQKVRKIFEVWIPL